MQEEEKGDILVEEKEEDVAKYQKSDDLPKQILTEMIDDQEGNEIALETLHKQPAEKNQTQELSEMQDVAPEVQDETTRLGRSEEEEEEEEDSKTESEKKDEKGKELGKEKEKEEKAEETDDQEMNCVSLTISIQLCERNVQQLEVISV